MDWSDLRVRFYCMDILFSSRLASLFSPVLSIDVSFFPSVNYQRSSLIETATMASSRVVKLIPSKTCFFVCDIQEAFRPVIYSYPSVLSVCNKMIRAAPLLSIPVVITEQNPSRLGKTVPLPQDAMLQLQKEGKVVVFEKTKFSMMLPEVLQKLKAWDIESVVIFGIEVRYCCCHHHPSALSLLVLLLIAC